MYHQELYDAAARRGQVTAWPSFSLCRLTAAAAVQSSLALVVHLRHTVDDDASYSRQRASVVFPFFVKKTASKRWPLFGFLVFWFCWVVTNKV